MENLLSLGPIGLEDAKRIERVMSKENVTIFLDHNERTCTRGCSVTVEVKFYEKDLEKIRAYLQDEFRKQVEGLDINFEALNSVYDPAMKEATCPACGAIFSTSEKECPDCGLVLA